MRIFKLDALTDMPSDKPPLISLNFNATIQELITITTDNNLDLDQVNIASDTPNAMTTALEETSKPGAVRGTYHHNLFTISSIKINPETSA